MSESSVFSASDQPGANSNSSPNQNATAAYYTAGDVAESIGASVTTVKRIASEMRLDVQHTVGGLKLYTAAQVEKIQRERERRQVEASR